jgi:hypothetical protein
VLPDGSDGPAFRCTVLLHENGSGHAGLRHEAWEPLGLAMAWADDGTVLFDLSGNEAPSLLSAVEAAHVLHVAWGGLHGYEPGSFVTLLIRAFMSADPMNWALLATAYPGYGSGVRLFKEHPNGVGILSAVSKGGH